MMFENNKNNNIKVLFVGDPNLGDAGFKILQKYYSHADCAIWDKGDILQKKKINTSILAGQWDILVSFYNDLIFNNEEIESVGLALNIHPSSPQVRGVAYDKLPLIEAHHTFGSTLHILSENIDSGMIIDVIEEPLPPTTPYTEFRHMTQRLSLKMLENFVLNTFQLQSLYEIEQSLVDMSKKHQKKWSEEYYSRQKLESVLAELKALEPEHIVFK